MPILRTVGRFVAAGMAVLVTATVVGGTVFSAVEDVSLLDGLWLAFSVVSTTGFGAGPTTAGGMVVSMVLFVVAIVGYLLVGVGAMAWAAALDEDSRESGRSMLVERDVRRVVRDLHRN